MYIGISPQALAKRIIDERPFKRDFVAPTKLLTATPEGRIQFQPNGDVLTLTPTKHALNQIAAHAGIPGDYAEKMRTEMPALWAENVNAWFGKHDSRRLIRTLMNGDSANLRALMSEKFREIDYYDVATQNIPVIEAAGCKIVACDITESRMYIQAVSEQLVEQIKSERALGIRHAFRDIKDIVHPAITISTSEVGQGAYNVESGIVRSYCNNLTVMTTVLRRIHVGRGRGSEFGDEAREWFTDETRKADDTAFWLKSRDLLQHALSPDVFQSNVAKLNGATEIALPEKLSTVIEVTREQFGLSEAEGENVLTHLAREGDLTLYGLHNALTNSADEADGFDRAYELQRFGARVIELGQPFVARIAKAVALN